MSSILSSILTLLLFLPMAGLAFSADEATVEFFSPQGTVKSVRQATARFSEQMVPFGDPRISDPFDISCPEKSKGRWADARNWVYDFDRDLPSGIKCEFTTVSQLKTIAGKTVKAASFAFSTGGPAIRLSRPNEGNTNIDEEQIFVIVLDAEPDEASLRENVYFTASGINEKIGIRIITGEERRRIFEAVNIRSITASITRDYVALRADRAKAENLPPIVVLQAKQRFPAQSDIRLIWGKGVKSASGISTDKDQALPFKVRKPFTAAFSCQRERKDAACIPVLPPRLAFSAPVAWEVAKKIKLKGPGGKIYKALPSSARGSDSDDSDESEYYAPPAEVQQKEIPEFVSSIFFKAPLPEKSSFVLMLPTEFMDDAGRKLANADRFPLTIKTEAYPPLAKFSSRFGIIELKGDAALPVTLRNLEPEVKTRKLKVEDRKKDSSLTEKMHEGLYKKAIKVGTSVTDALPDSMKKKSGEMVDGLKGRLRKLNGTKEEKILDWLRATAGVGRQRSLLKGADDVTEFSLPKPAGAKTFEVIGIPLKEPGLYIVELESQILGASLLDDGKGLLQKKPIYVPTAALVTNLSVHFKKGRESSMVWVTSLDNAKPVPNAAVSVTDCTGKTIWTGKTDRSGIARINKALPEREDITSCRFDSDSDNYDSSQAGALHGLRGGLFVFAKKDKDLSFVHTSWNEGIESWRFNLPSASYNGPVIANTIFDRTLLRAGETVSMKHIIRRQTVFGFEIPKSSALPDIAVIEHLGNDKKFEFPLKWNASGIAETAWKVPADANLGEYQVSLAKKTKKKNKRTPVEYDSVKRWISGGFRVEEFRVPMMKGLIQPPKQPSINTPEIETDLMVTYLAGGGSGNADIKLRSSLQPKSVRFDDYDDFYFANGAVKEGVVRSGFSSEDEEENSAGKPRIDTKALRLDASGALRTKLGPYQKADVPREVAAELEFRDPNGEIQTVSQRIPLWNSRVIVGIKPDSWAASKDAFKFQLIALDLKGKPAAGVTIKADLYGRKIYSHRKRLVGGFYAYEHTTETKKIGPICEGITDNRGLVICDAKSPLSGNIIVQAAAADADGNTSVANREIWIYGKSDWWFDVSDNDRIDLLPEKKRYEPGEVAKFQVRMPFREATVLVTVEREGIMEAFIKKLSGKNPVIELPVTGSYAPNIYVSALCVRGRIEGIKPTAMIDLGKPAYKLGIAEIKVGWKAHELKVDVSAAGDTYKIREKVPVKIKVRTADGKLPPAGSEVALAAVDEGLLELMPNNSWKLLEAMMARRGYEVSTYTAQMQVIGKRHYGLKAIAAGGGGGKQPTREMFDTLLIWKGRLKLDANGEAAAEVPLNDSMTSFRIVAIANGGAGMFGTGYTSVRSTQDLMILSGIPPLAREGDTFTAGVTVRNASKRMLNVAVTASASAIKNIEPITVSLNPGEAKDAGWSITVPLGIDSITWDFAAKEITGDASDKVRVKQKVIAAIPVSTYQATLTQITGPARIEVERPADAIPGRGGISVTLRPKIAEGQEAIAEYMKAYPYTCLEQKISVAIALRNKQLWKNVMSEISSYLDSDGLLKYFPLMREGSDSLTAYALSISEEAGWEIPQAVKEGMIRGLTGFVNGKVIRYSAMPTADLSIRKVAALEALSRHTQVKNNLLGSISIDPNLWPTSSVIDWMGVLQRSKDLAERTKRFSEAYQILRSRLNFQGTTMGFSTEKTDYLWWLMVSIDTNAVRTILAMLNVEGANEDIPRLMTAAVARQYKGRWNTTTANAWGVLALEKFSARYESVNVSGRTTAALAHQEKSLNWAASPKGGSMMLQWPKGKDTLAVAHQGSGRPWAVIRTLAAIPLKEPLSSGYRIKKTMIPVSQKESGRWSRGDVVRIKLEIESQADMTWVVVNDPIPSSASILGTGLGRDSELLTSGEKKSGWAWPAFEERTFSAFRAYYDYVAKGKWTVEYTIRLNNDGLFQLPETRVEAMYAPEMYGVIPNKKMDIKK